MCDGWDAPPMCIVVVDQAQQDIVDAALNGSTLAVSDYNSD